MAVIARETWANIKTRHAKAMGRESDTTYTATNGRAERFVTGAYFDLCLLYHHYELDTVDATLTLSTSSNALALPADCYAVLAFELRAVGTSAFIKMLVPESPEAIISTYDGTAGQPDHYARFGNSIYFDTLPDVAYESALYYYALPTAPDFSSGSPAFGRLWDEHLIELSVAMAHGQLWRPDLADSFGQRLSTFLGLVAQPALRHQPLTGHTSEGTRELHYGGPQGR